METTDKEIHELQGRRMTAINTPRTRRIAPEETAEYHQAALQRIRDGLATRVRILVSHESCPVCRSLEGAYEFDDVPALPPEGCSNPGGCRAYYAPVLDRFGP